MAKVFIGLGSNLEGPKQQLDRAVEEIRELRGSNLKGVSSYYISSPLAGIDIPKFINAVVEIETELTPYELLYELKELERKHKRKPTYKWGARSLDLDILLYEGVTLASENLTIPHSEMHKRDFVLVPLASLEAGIEIPKKGKVEELLKVVPSNGLKLYIEETE